MPCKTLPVIAYTTLAAVKHPCLFAPPPHVTLCRVTCGARRRYCRHCRRWFTTSYADCPDCGLPLQ